MDRLNADTAFRVGFLALAAVGLSVRGERVHWGLAIGAALLFVAYVALLFVRLG